MSSSARVQPAYAPAAFATGCLWATAAAAHLQSLVERAAELEPNYTHALALASLYERTVFNHKAFESWERCLRVCPKN